MSWKYFIAFAIVALSIILWLQLTPITIPTSLQGTLLSAKITFAAITIPAMTFYSNIFWSGADSIDKQRQKGKQPLITYSDLVRYHAIAFVFLFGSSIFAFLSVGAELYASYIGAIGSWFFVYTGMFLTSILLVFSFVLLFLVRMLGEMQSLKKADELSRKGT